MKKKALNICILLLATVSFPFVARTQTSVTRMVSRADSARLSYDFKLASDLCQKAVETDSTVREKIEDLLIASQNGLSMEAFCSQPVVVARQTFPLKDFFLFYPLENHSWRKTPN